MTSNPLKPRKKPIPCTPPKTGLPPKIGLFINKHISLTRPFLGIPPKTRLKPSLDPLKPPITPYIPKIGYLSLKGSKNKRYVQNGVCAKKVEKMGPPKNPKKRDFRSLKNR